MPVVHFVNQRITVRTPHGRTLLDTARDAHILLESPCGGTGTCGKCTINIRESAQGAEQTVRACRYPVTGDIEARIAERPLAPLSVGADISGAAAGHAIPEKAEAPDGPFGIAFDIGTTTLAAVLVDLTTGTELAFDSAFNPQVVYAQDVISRIHYAARKEVGGGGGGKNGEPETTGLAVLRNALLDALNTMTVNLCEKTGIKPEQILKAVYSGNTAMLHIALGIDPAPLGRAPYTPAYLGGDERDAKSGPEGLRIAPGGTVYIPPVISGFVGADITAGVIMSALDRRSETTLFIDIGTNGEMVLVHSGTLIATATAAGPAFEGMNISSGMRASEGAIESFCLDETGSPSFKVIGGGEPRGICGSGLLDIIAALVVSGAIAPSGRLPKDYPIGGSVFLSQKDVRETQLAKSAIRTGIELLLARFNLSAASVDRIEIAGSFGFHLKEQSLIDIGLLPPAFRGKVVFTGNTSLAGARLLLLDQSLRDAAAALVRRIATVDLAADPHFEDTFVEQMAFG